MISLALILAAAPASGTLEAALQKAVQRAPARVELTSWDAPRRCKGAFVPAPFETSGRVAVKVKGKNCEAWGWAEVKVIVPVATLSRDVKANESLDGAWSMSDGEASARAVQQLPAGASAMRPLKAGSALTESDFRVGPRAGTPVTVRVMLGSLSLEARGTVTQCSGAATCATLVTGKRVAGLFIDGVLVVGGDL
jgi:hypothetical protein